MKITRNTYQQFNTPDTLLVISSFPEEGGEVAVENAVARYVDLVLGHFPNKQKAVVLSEKRVGKPNTPFLAHKNILVIPTFETNSLKLFKELQEQVQVFSNIQRVHVQFEFNILGEKFVTGFLPLFLHYLKSQKKFISIMLHHVVTDINELSEHVGIKQNSIPAKLTNGLLRSFYGMIGQSADVVMVHDELLLQKLVDIVPAEKMYVIPHGIMPVQTITPTMRTKARKKFGFKKKENVILVYGYQSWYKGTDWAVENIAQFAKKNPSLNVKILLAGSISPTQQDLPTYKKFLTRLNKVTKKYSKYIVSTGFVPEEQVPEIFAAADISVYPYRARMSASGALSLAFQYRVPFAVSPASGSNFYEQDVLKAMKQVKLRHDQFTFSLEDDSICEILAQILKSRTLQQKMKKMGTRVTKARTWSKVAKMYIELAFMKRRKKVPRRKHKLPSLSVFFPMHNEEENVERVIKHAQAILPKIAHQYEIIIVNDGSTDQTSTIAHRFARQSRRVRVIDQKNMGYGGALQTGFQAARYEWIFFSDGDMQFDLGELSDFVPKTQENKVILGYRTHRADPWERIMLANMLKVWNQFFFQFPSGIQDIDCAFKLFHRSVIDEIFPLMSHGAMISTELLLRVADAGYTYTQVGVTHYPRLYGNQTGAKANVIIGAVKETLKLVYHRSFLPSWRVFSRYAAVPFPVLLFILIYTALQPKQ